MSGNPRSSPEAVAEALKISDRYVETLRGCIQIRGGINLETTVTFPEGKVAMDKLSQCPIKHQKPLKNPT